jgi:DNA-binding IclR family transcriptional regulator
VLSKLEPLAEQTHDLDVFQAIRTAVERHGGGPYPAAELATIAGADPATVRRVLAQMVTDGLAAPANELPNECQQ